MFILKGNPLYFFSTFSTISKKSNLEGVFEFFYTDPQLDQNLKPTRNLCGQLLYTYLSIYVYRLYYILKRKNIKDTFNVRPTRPTHPTRQIKYFDAKIVDKP